VQINFNRKDKTPSNASRASKISKVTEKENKKEISLLYKHARK
jgi:hypothetical protein